VFFGDDFKPNWGFIMYTKHRVSIKHMNSCIHYFTSNFTISSCPTNNFSISNHGMTRKVHNMYCNFISMQIMRSILYIYDWIYPILLFSNYIRHFFHIYPWYVALTLMLGFCINPYATRFASSPPHRMYSNSIMFSQRPFSLVTTSWIDHFEYQHTQPS
jgi:hypothetical protein